VWVVLEVYVACMITTQQYIGLGTSLTSFSAGHSEHVASDHSNPAPAVPRSSSKELAERVKESVSVFFTTVRNAANFILCSEIKRSTGEDENFGSKYSYIHICGKTCLPRDRV
jgi:hypothetical protein